MMKTLLLKFSGPLQSWGTSSHFKIRHTDYHPSKSAVIGILSACLGYRRTEDEKISALNALDFAVRVDQPGHLLRDYHTARKMKSNGVFHITYVTNRYYLEDAVFVVAIGGDDELLIETIENGIKNQYFQPFMGRRSLPLPWDVIIETTNDSVIEAIQNVPWQASAWYKKKGAPSLMIYADAGLLDHTPVDMRRDRVVSFSQKNRQFEFRGESSMLMELKDFVRTDEHDAFEAIGD